MNMKFIRSSFFIFIIIGASLGAYLLYQQLSIKTVKKFADDFMLSASFSKDNTWDYTITGDLPNPCYEYEVKEIPNDNNFTITLSIVNPSDNIICTQIIDPVRYSSSFLAPDDIEILFLVEYKDSTVTDTDTISHNIDIDTFSLEKEYSKDLGWTYSINGNIPDCVEVRKTDVQVLESYPEQIYIVLAIQSKNSNCDANKLVQFFESGSIKASDEAIFSIKLEKI
ncbi:hypothetical protein KC669_04700 [Candidatus Dojkabacteria bacterium]|uniref:Uncharacterized protein n=1 Tax=Candidatus Dojkabacteria bacterium TaxID=2099670 RepID=A0A955LC34_9BACT|nr:hypothetical protein [Candidatus Dojkabacteria bacterium]